MDTTDLRHAYTDLLEAAQASDFNPPPSGEWDVEHLLAHLVSVDASITAVALAVAGGARPAYDNRVSLDPWTLERITSVSGGAGALRERVRHHGELLCSVAGRLHESELAVMVPTLILSNDQVMLDQPIPLAALIGGLAEVHLPGHAEQLRALHAT